MPKTYLSLAILIIVFSGAFLLVWPKYQELNSLNANINNSQLELQSKTEYFNNIKTVSEELKNYQDSLSKISTALPSDPLLPATFGFFQNIASQSGLVLEEVAVGSITSLEGESINETEEIIVKQVQSIDFAVKLSGSYESFKSFLESIELSARIIEIKNIHFETPEEDNTPFSFELELSVYYY